jgi:hypothetical protein
MSKSATASIIKNIAYTTPLLGAIRIGHVEERGGKRIPQKDDHFTITENFKAGGRWVAHPLNDKVKKGQEKLTEIPVKVIYSKADLNVTERYEAYDRQQKRLVCAGNGERAKRLEKDGTATDQDCEGADKCQWIRQQGSSVSCGMFGRALFKVDGQDDELSGFMFRYGSYNGVNTLRKKITDFEKRYGDKLLFMPLKLVLRAKATAMSMGSIFYYGDIVLAGNELELVKEAAVKVKEYGEAGINLAEFEEAALALRNNGRFEIDPSEEYEDREEFVIGSEGIVIDSGQQENGQAGGTKIAIVPNTNGAMPAAAVGSRGGKNAPKAATSLANVQLGANNAPAGGEEKAAPAETPAPALNNDLAIVHTNEEEAETLY